MLYGIYNTSREGYAEDLVTVVEADEDMSKSDVFEEAKRSQNNATITGRSNIRSYQVKKIYDKSEISKAVTDLQTEKKRIQRKIDELNQYL